MKASATGETPDDDALTMTRTLRQTRGGTCHSETQFALHDAGALVELHCRVQPRADAVNFGDQVRSVYDELLQLLFEHRLSIHDVLCERLFFSDIACQFGHARQVRASVYGGDDAECQPATTYLQQPPCQEGRQIELQAYALRSRDGSHDVHTLTDLPAPASGKLLTSPGYSELFLSNLVGPADQLTAGFGAQCAGLFEQLGTVLRVHSIPVSQLVRTWIYLRDLADDYEELNHVRNAAFADWGVRRLPASTGIEGGTSPIRWRCAADAYAVWGEGPLDISVMHGDTLGEANDYGAAFSRGLRVERSDRTVLYVSGTASIDQRGDVVHGGDARGQSHRMLDNIEALLHAQGAGLSDVVSAVTYLKSRSYLPLFEEVFRERGVPADMINSFVEADVCRAEWLCEIELTAMLPPG